MYEKELINIYNEYSYNYLKSIHTTAVMVFKYAKRFKLVHEIITDDVIVPTENLTGEEEDERMESFQENYLELDELELFLSTAISQGLENDFHFFSLLGYTGVRVGELLALQIDRYDPVEKSIYIARTLYNESSNRGKYELLRTKTKKSRRHIPLDDFANEVVQRQLRYRKTLEEGPFFKERGFLFCSDKGYPMHYRSVANRFARLLRISKINKDITLHSFRHTHTALLIEANVPLPSIAERLGHSDITTTYKVYSKITGYTKDKSLIQFQTHLKDTSSALKTKLENGDGS